MRKFKEDHHSQVLAVYELRTMESQSQSRRASSPSSQDRAILSATAARRSGDDVGEPRVCHTF